MQKRSLSGTASDGGGYQSRVVHAILVWMIIAKWVFSESNGIGFVAESLMGVYLCLQVSVSGRF